MTTQQTNLAQSNQLSAPTFARLGGQLGVLLCVLGFAVIFFGWNGAASKNVSMAQFPYLISGGIVGIAIVVIGAAMLIVQNAREDRARLEAVLERLVAATEAGGSGQRSSAGTPDGGGALVLAGSSSYHRLDCGLPQAREEAHVMGLQEAFARQLEPCRVCRPPALAPSPGH